MDDDAAKEALLQSVCMVRNTFGNASHAITIQSGAKASAVAGWYMLERADGTVAIVPTKEAAQKLTPPRRLGWEGHGGQSKDSGPTAEQAFTQAVYEAMRNLHKDIGGAQVANAITALHGQRRSDGQSRVFHPGDRMT